MLPHRRSTSRGCGPLEVDRYKPVRGSVTYSYGLWQRNPHRSPSCESDAWPFCADPVLFEARRAVGQAVRTTFDFLPSDAVASGVLKYIVIAKAIEGKLHDTDTAAQKRFGNNPTPDRRDLPPMERQVVNITNELLAAFPYDSPDGIR